MSRRLHLAWLACALFGCTRPTRVISRDAAVSDAPSSARSLDSYAVDDDRPWRAVLYSWAPPERAREMARDGSVLTATTRTGPYLTPFSALLLRLQRASGQTGSIARALVDDPALHRYRYAWANAFGVARGFQARSYGSSLVRITLRPDALILRLDPSDARVFRLFDSAQREVDLSRFDARRDRVAAVYHVRRAPDVPVAFREYVVCNAEAVASWEIATDMTCRELATERAMVTRSLDALTSDDAGAAQVDRCWRASNCDRSFASRWFATMATAAPHYLPTRENLAALRDSIATCDVSVVRAP